MRVVLLQLIRVYRYCISPLLGDRCRFTPSCSIYAEEAIKAHGAARGVILAAGRLARCHPWCEGGNDPVPLPKDASINNNAPQRKRGSQH